MRDKTYEERLSDFESSWNYHKKFGQAGWENLEPILLLDEEPSVCRVLYNFERGTRARFYRMKEKIPKVYRATWIGTLIVPPGLYTACNEIIGPSVPAALTIGVLGCAYVLRMAKGSVRKANDMEQFWHDNTSLFNKLDVELNGLRIKYPNGIPKEELEEARDRVEEFIEDTFTKYGDTIIKPAFKKKEKKSLLAELRKATTVQAEATLYSLDTAQDKLCVRTIVDRLSSRDTYERYEPYDEAVVNEIMKQNMRR